MARSSPPEPVSDEQFEIQFRDCTLDPIYFAGHEPHVRLAWIHVTKYGVDTAIDNLCTQIRAFDRRHGEGDKFDRALTISATRLVASFVDRRPFACFEDFINAYPELRFNFRELLNGQPWNRP